MYPQRLLQRWLDEPDDRAEIAADYNAWVRKGGALAVTKAKPFSDDVVHDMVVVELGDHILYARDVAEQLMHVGLTERMIVR